MSFYFSDSGDAGDDVPYVFIQSSLYLNSTFLYAQHFYSVISYICHAILPVAYHSLYPVIMPD